MGPRSILPPLARLAGAVAWLAFPVVPLVAADAYQRFCTDEFVPTSSFAPDPHVWDATRWAMVLGPLVGYGFLAGSTWGIADEPGPRRWWRAGLAWRSVWVGLGPWAVFLAGAALYHGGMAARSVVPLDPERWSGWNPLPWAGPWLYWGLMVPAMVTLSIGWLPIAYASLRRARRAGRLGSAWSTGLGLAAAFVGSLFGGYRAITAAWRGYFFDPTIVP